MNHVCDGSDATCEDCAAIVQRREVVRSAMTLDDRLDDIKRAQIWTRLDRALDAPAARRLPWRGAGALVACAAAAAACWIAVRRAPEPRAFVAPADSTLTAHVGPHTRAELIGPARLELDGTPGDATRVRLRAGTLVAEFTGGPGRSLRIEAPGAVVEIVGTLFSVEVTGDQTCVSVAHGKVAVTTRTDAFAVGTGESWCTTRTQVEAIPAAARERFDRFAALAVASRAPVVTPIVPPVVTSIVPPVVTPIDPPVVTPMTGSAAPVEVTGVEPPSAEAPHAEAPRSEPARRKTSGNESTEPTATAPVRSTPTESEPAPAASTRVASTRSEPAQIAPAPAEAARTEPARTEPARTEDSDARPPAVAPAQPVVPPVTAESLYHSAEAALGKHDLAAADRALAALVAGFADSPLVDQAIYERARIAYGRHAWADARRQLEKLAENPATPLAEPGAYLACRIAVESHDNGAAHCLSEYRTTYPSSPHDLDVLGLLVDLAYRDGGCRGATASIDELVRRHPGTRLARAWHARCEARP